MSNKTLIKFFYFHIIFFSCIFNLDFAFGSKKISGEKKLTRLEIKDFDLNLEQSKKKITSLLLLKQRQQALEIIARLEDKFKSSSLYLQKTAELKLTIITQFLNSESQDSFELAATQYLINPKVALKNAQQCLQIEPDHLLCLWAEAKALNYAPERNQFGNFRDKFKLISAQNKWLQPLTISLEKSGDDFKSLNLSFLRTYLLSQTLSAPIYDIDFILTLLELEQALTLKDLNKSKERLKALTKISADFVDLIFFEANIFYLESEITKNELMKNNSQSLITVYQKKCKAIPLDTARKYFFDINFCHRRLQ